MEEANKIIEQAKSAEALLLAELEPSKRKALVRQLQAQVSSLQQHTNSIGNELAGCTIDKQDVGSEIVTSDTKDDEVESVTASHSKVQEACELTVDASEPGVIAAGA